MMLAVGDQVRLLPPFDVGQEAAVFTIEAVQFVAADGTISTEPTDLVQYVISGAGFESVAFALHFLEQI